MPRSSDETRTRLARLVHHPRGAMAVKAALAATAAWLLALQLPTGAEYGLYAPFGAVVTMHSAFARTAAESVRGVSAITLGAALGLVADRFVAPQVLAIAVVVGTGVLLAGIPWLGASRAYVPVAGMFVLLIGQGQEVGFAAAYAGFFLLGAVVALAVDAALPTLPVREADHAVGRLRTDVVAHLRHVAQHLAGEGGQNPLGEGGPGRARLAQLLDRARAAVRDVEEAARANVRARRNPTAVTHRDEDFRALERAALLVDDLYALAADEPWGTDVGRLSPELREPMSRALLELADAVRELGVRDTEPGRRDAVDAAVQELGRALREHARRHGPEGESLVVATVVTTLRRMLSALTPSDLHLSTGPISRLEIRQGIESPEDTPSGEPDI